MSISTFVFSCVACSAFVPPEDSVSKGAYDSCMASVELMNSAVGSRNQDKILQVRDYCSCSAKILWEAEQQLGWSVLEDEKTGLKVFEKCATPEQRREKQQQTDDQKRKESERQKFIDSIDSLFR